MALTLSSELLARLKKIQCLLLDVDGVLTDCRVFLDSNGEWKRMFSIRDGYGIVLMKESGYRLGVMTGSKAKDIQERARVLGLHYFHEGSTNKLPAFESILKESGLRPEQIAYMGDDDFDIPVLREVGFAATVPDAMEKVLESVHYVSARPGGNGAVREICELILKYGAFSKGHS